MTYPRITLSMTDLFRFAQMYRAPKMSDQHNILSITEQSLKRYKKSLMTQYTAVLRHQVTLYAILVVADLAMI